MKRRRLLSVIGLAAASGGILVACGGAPKVTLPTTTTGVGVGPVSFHMPTLQAPVVTPEPAAKPSINQLVPEVAPSTAKASSEATDQTSFSARNGAYASEGCAFGH